MKLPEALKKSLWDDFEYRLCTKQGTIMDFSSASIEGMDVTDGEEVEVNVPDNSEWVHLFASNIESPHAIKDRGRDVRLSEIVWVEDTGN